MIDNIIEAIAFAKIKHTGQKRKFTGEPYIHHPIRVATNAIVNNLPVEAILAAYLHDTVEDTNTTLDEVREKFGDVVASLVAELTLDKSAYHDRESRTIYITARVDAMSDVGFSIKLMDRLDNVTNLIKAPEKFAKKYYLETSYIMDNITPRSELDVKLINEIRACIQPVYEKYW